MFAPDTAPIRLDAATRRLLKDQEARKAWVMYRLRLRGLSMAAVAEKAGVKPHTLYVVWHRPYPRLEKAIADQLGLQPKDIFPDRYDAAGRPARRMGRPVKKSANKQAKHNSRATPCNDKARSAA